ncbi:flagellar filament capping protein FliD [Pandoraea communis]|uniref:flagellar filament capping protein FliD n=1 Tax=Pandoraea communis TaxID=2508297 RepID=UPI0025A4FB9A|nr:flagellar filament capping protein FliD [Pandoraea communis]MDM8354939.1 flagellar filament capping protein FliD [Pandoraea communis]
MATSSSAGSISSPGIGSGLDVNALVASLMQPATNKLNLLKSQEASYQSRLSAVGNLKSALSTFQSALSALATSSSFLQMTTNVGDSTILSATASNGAAAGNYLINVSQLAQAQSLTTGGVKDQTGVIGTGTPTKVTFTFGTITDPNGNRTLTNGQYTNAGFDVNGTQSPFSVTIDSSNNSLQGIRDAINAAKGGVTATIVNDGSDQPARLVLTSTATGQAMSMKIDVDASGDPAIQNLLNYDPTGTQNLTQAAAGQNANLTVNGLAITSASNSVSNSVQGLTLNLLKIGSTTVTTTTNSGAVTTAVTNFVSAYNTLQGTLSSLTAYDAAGQGANNGPLIGDSTVQLIQARMQTILNGRLPGVSATGLTSLAQIGVTFQADGTLAVDSSTLSKAITNNGLSQLASLLATNGITTDSLISYAGSTSNTQPGQYDINITRSATQGSLVGSVSLSASTQITTDNNTLYVQVDGKTASITIPVGTYTPDKLATAIQGAINGNSAFTTNSSTVAVTQKNGILTMSSNRYGSASNVRVLSGSGQASLFGTSTPTDGVDVQGTIGGYSATGSGQTLTGSTGTPVEGLKLTVTGSSIGSRGSVSFSQGYASLLSNQLTDFLGSKGAISNATDSINSSIKQIQQQETDWQDQMTQMQNRYMAQFTALDATMAKLQNTSDYLKQVLGGSSSSSSSSK